MKTIFGIIVAAFIIVTIFFSGVVVAAETSFDLNVTGNSFSDVNYKMSTPTGLPYEKNGYSLRVFMVDGKDTTFNHYLNVGGGVEAKTTLVTNGSDIDSVIWIDESTRREVIGGMVINENITSMQCYSANAGYSVAANRINYGSTIRVTGLGVDYAVAAAGRGDMRWVSEEYIASGEIVTYVNDTDEEEEVKEDIPAPGEGNASTFWTSSCVREDIRANGVFEFVGSYHSEFSDFPAPAPEDEIDRLCPFGWGD